VAPVTTVPVGALCTLATVCICTSGNPVQLSAYGDVQQTSGATWGCTFFRRCGAPNTDFRPQFFESVNNINESIALTYIDNPPAGNYCYALMGCVCTVAPNSANFGETLGPVLNTVELGTVAPGMAPAWTSAGTIQSVGIGATITAPTITTTTYNNVRYRQLGPKEWEVQAVFKPVNGGTTTGNGYYLFTLPNGLQFDTSSSYQLPYQNVPDDNQSWLFYGLINSYARASQNGATSYQQSTIVPWDATRYRIMLVGPNTDFWRNGYYTIGSTNQAFKWGFTFRTP
jgi:hypothetical protein